MRAEKVVLKALTKAKGRPVGTDEVVSAARARGIDEESALKALRTLAASGRASEVSMGKYVALPGRNLAVGRLSVNRRGFGFVEAPGGDIYIRARDMAGALHGDTVAVRLVSSGGRGRGRSGEVAHVVERGNSLVVGRYWVEGRVGIVTPTDPRVRTEVMVAPAASKEAQRGDIVVARITRFPTGRDAAQGVIDEVVGPEGAPGIDVETIIREHGLRTEFPSEALTEAEAIPTEVGELEPGREDLRDLFTITIDPAEARDFDDAISCVREGKGFRLWVHIADVANYVPWASAIDQEAVRRATSVYLVDRVLPMLPERLSNGICSLAPGVDRLTMTVEMLLDRTGLVEEYKLYPSVIRSDRRLAYEQVDEWLGSGGWPDAEIERLLLDFRDIAKAIGERRVARGGLDFETVEARVLLDADGKPTDVKLRERTVATNMIEEAMIAANEVVAGHMVAREAPMVFRIHEDPQSDALAQIAAVLAEFDYPIKDLRNASPATFQRIVEFAHTRPEKLLINSLLLRALQRARYVDYLDSHFGLASSAYTHFTSPIRRYPDLIVHRLLKAELAGERDSEAIQSMVAELAWLAEHSSTMEREAEAAEDETTKLKLAELMAEHLGEVFEGIITGVATFGFFVQLANTAEGLVHVESMMDDYFRYDAERFWLQGDASGRTYRLGQALSVRIVDVVVSERRIEMELA